MEDEARVLVEILTKEASKGQPFEITKFLQNCALNVICGECVFCMHQTNAEIRDLNLPLGTAMGVTVDAQINANNDYVLLIDR
jgi:hypothetical protein